MDIKHYIAHFDIDSFFVSVEIINNPTLKGKPVLVGGSKERGVVAACSYEARKFGIHSAMQMRKAFQLCPNAIIVKGSRGEYGRYSKWVTEIIAARAPLYEKASIDEFYIDLTGMDKYFDPLQWAIELRNEIIEQTKLPISFGLAPNKLLAKIATDEAKPNGYIYVQHGMEREFLSPLKVSKIPGVGDRSFLTLKKLNLNYIGDIHKKTKKEMEECLGNWGVDLWEKSNGIYHGIVTPFHIAKSISTENTFEKNLTKPDEMVKEIVRMSEKVAYELRSNKNLSSCISVKIRYADFETTSKQKIVAPTNRDDEIIPSALDLFEKLLRKGSEVRLLGVKLSHFKENHIQGNIFNDSKKVIHLYQAIDSIKDKFGASLLVKARTINKNK